MAADAAASKSASLSLSLSGVDASEERERERADARGSETAVREHGTRDVLLPLPTPATGSAPVV